MKSTRSTFLRKLASTSAEDASFAVVGAFVLAMVRSPEFDFLTVRQYVVMRNSQLQQNEAISCNSPFKNPQNMESTVAKKDEQKTQ